jgi:hypothetical protein
MFTARVPAAGTENQAHPNRCPQLNRKVYRADERPLVIGKHCRRLRPNCRGGRDQNSTSTGGTADAGEGAAVASG